MNSINSTSFTVAHLDDDPLELKNFKRTFLNHSNDFSSNNRTASSVHFCINSFHNSKNLFHFLQKTPQVHFCVLDIQLSKEEDLSGIDCIQFIKSQHPQCIVIINSFYENSSDILNALSKGADDFLSKLNPVRNLCSYFINLYQNFYIKHGLNDDFLEPNFTSGTLGFNFVGKTAHAIHQRAKKIIDSAVKSILIEGESGTGKEIVADIFNSVLKNNLPFLRVNCAALSPHLLESELFGYKKGAFTGATQDKTGLIESANGGFIFLDEISSLSEHAQILLLRTIENQEILRIGDIHPRKINVRFLCATNVSLPALVLQNKFRNDLYQRLCEVEIFLPPLRTRKDEIPYLIDYFCENLNSKKYHIDPLAKKVLCSYDWEKGNIRELRNTLRAMSEFADNDTLGVSSLPSRLYKNLPSPQPNVRESENILNQSIKITLEENGRTKTYQELCDEMFAKIIQNKKQKNSKINVSKLANELKISRTTLLSKIKLIDDIL